MPVHMDIRVNKTLVQRIHVSRMSRNGMQPDSINEYSVVVSEQEPVFLENRTVYRFPEEPTWLQWEQGVRFQHRYGDDATMLMLNALQALKSHSEEL